MVRLALVVVLGAQLALFEWVVLTGRRFATVPIPRSLLACVIALPFLAAIGLLLLRSARQRKLQAGALLIALAMTFRFHSPAMFERMFPRVSDQSASIAAVTSPSLVQFLREVSAAQEQYRRTVHRYANDISELRRWVKPPAGVIVSMRARADSGWMAIASLDGSSCKMWVRDSAMRHSAGDIEGSPSCGAPELRTGRHSIESVVTPATENEFLTTDIRGEWRQHRAQASRSGKTEESGPAGYTWTARIPGPIRSSAAIAGNQVFIGAHGNGEFAALSLSTGRLGYRIRVPNWVHHEPVVSESVLVMGFGNNEPSPHGLSILGSPPSGVAAYDRVSGIERWRAYTRGSVMTSPVLAKNIVAVITGSSEAVGWDLTSGREVWRAPLPDHSPMGNPALVDSVMVFGVEPATVCALVAATGRRLYCKVLDVRGWGAGHASIAVAGDIALQVYEADPEGWGVPPDSKFVALARRVIGLPPKRQRQPPPDAVREQVLAALRLQDGKEQWRVGLGRGTRRVPGHIAGTPAVDRGVAYVPSPTSGAVVAIEVATGRVIWSAPVLPARGSVLVSGGKVFAATSSGTVVLDAGTGAVLCRQRLTAGADRAGPAVSGGTAVLTLLDGTVMARPLDDWLSCAAVVRSSN